MKIYTSYFYQIRKFKPYQIPLSTAVWDPKWYHNFSKNRLHYFIDGRGVINGLRIPYLVPGNSCNGLCRGRESCNQNYKDCLFLKNYSSQLHKLDFDEVYKYIDTIADQAKSLLNFEQDPEIVLMVYEVPSNHCSERIPIQKWFEENGVHVEELNIIGA